MDPSKIESIIKMPVDKTQSSIKAFIGAASFYRRWVSSFAKIAAPLNALLKKEIDIEAEWAKDPMKYENAIRFLKSAMAASWTESTYQKRPTCAL
eukprot:SAG22_NODE_489_length_9845_cov_5.954550_7_plen_95_part_00